MTREQVQNQVVAMITGSMLHAMARAHLNIDNVAAKMGVDRAVVCQMLDCSGRLTLVGLGDFLWACDLEVDDVTFTPTPEESTDAR